MPLALCVCLLGVTTVIIPGRLPASFDAVAFEKLTAEERLASVRAVLWERERQLQNFSYELTHTFTNYSLRDGSKVASFGRNVCALKRKGAKLRLDEERFAEGGASTGQQAIVWDGSCTRSIVRRPSRKEPRGIVTASEQSNFAEIPYDRILGVRVPMRGRAPGPGMTLAEWFDDVRRKDVRIEVGLAKGDLAGLLAVAVLEGPPSGEYSRSIKHLLDPSRDFMPVRYEYLYQAGGSYNKTNITVAEAKRIDGLWVPFKVVYRTGTSADRKVETEEVCTVSKFERGTVKDEDFEIAYPAGMLIADEIAGIAYRILPGGKRQALLAPMLDSRTGEIIHPKITTPEEAAEMPPLEVQTQTAAPTARPTTPPLAQRPNQESPLVQQPPAGRRWLWAGVALLALGVGCVAAACWLICSRRRRNQSA